MKLKKILIGSFTSLTILTSATQVFASENISQITEQSTENFISTSKNVELIDDISENENYEENNIFINPRLRLSGTYNSDYDMTGGVYTKSSWTFSKTPTFNVKVTQKYYAGKGSANLGVILQRKSGSKWVDVVEKSTELKNSGSTDFTLKGDQAGTYRLYFRNYSGFSAKGDIYISFSD